MSTVVASTSGASVVPVALTGTEDVQPVGSRFPRRARVTIEFGEPLDLGHFGDASSGTARRRATDAVMAAVQAMSKQEPAGRYNEPPASMAQRMKEFAQPTERL